MMLTTAALAVGCDDNSLEIAREAADRQAEQNLEMSRLHREVASGAKLLVQNDAAARQDVVQLQGRLQAERATIAKGHEALEGERRLMDAARRQALGSSEQLKGVGAVVAALLTLGISWRVLSPPDPPNASLEDVWELVAMEALRGHVDPDAGGVEGYAEIGALPTPGPPPRPALPRATESP